MNRQTTTNGKPRKRSAVACNTCRAKRSRCDGDRPSCGTCSQACQKCEYTDKESNRKPPSKRYVEALLERIRGLEEEVQQYRPDKIPYSTTLGEGLSEPELLDETESDVNPASSDERSPIRELTDRLGRLNVGEDGQMRYFGSRSNFSLLRGRFVENSTTSTAILQDRAAATVRQLSLDVQYTEELQEHLLDLFWRWQNNWQYIVVKEPFLRDLHMDKTGGYASPLLLSAILALAARYSDRPEVRTDPSDPNTAGDALAARAKMLLLYESEAPTITTVQAAALLSLRETATDKESLGWVYCGMATRMAFNLGLHLDCSRWCKEGYFTEEAAEVRKVAWWGCYILDKLFNIGLGRPGTIQEHEVTAPLPSIMDNPEFTPWSPVPVAEPKTDLPFGHVITNCRSTCQLFQITAEALDEVYRPPRFSTKIRVLDLVSRTHVNLMEFYTNLPSCLRLPVSLSQPVPPHIYQLHLQYYVAIILLHRPFIRVRRNSGITTQRTKAITSHMKECIQAAEAVANIFKAYRNHYGLRQIPISAVHCAFTASIIFLVEATTEEVDGRHRTIRLLRMLTVALHEMSTAWAWSRRAIRALRQLAKEWSVSQQIYAALFDGMAGQSAAIQDSPSPQGTSQYPPALDYDALPWLFDDFDYDNQELTASLFPDSNQTYPIGEAVLADPVFFDGQDSLESNALYRFTGFG
ncbi:Fungal-specific transcription factor domain-containing protein [Pleurostoma richardsiae]|uniref:Fungal-specific transcription factor domain-containing protein n=1 Tax=Pleurostoma richardsiae TaxID=41990 RepID=A0AA38RW11_9PEZI|nr:Fungal-specific transcription factor domain-containing protein [Pleurostoma richardsiae]